MLLCRCLRDGCDPLCCNVMLSFAFRALQMILKWNRHDFEDKAAFFLVSLQFASVRLSSLFAFPQHVASQCCLDCSCRKHRHKLLLRVCSKRNLLPGGSLVHDALDSADLVSGAVHEKRADCDDP